MKKTTAIFAAAILASLAIVSPTTAQDMTPEQQQAMMKAMTPGKQHKNLSRWSGKFEYTSKMWMAPGAPPMESKGTSEAEMIMGGRYLQDKVVGNYGGMPFEGTGWTGYDNLKEAYTFVWIDNMGTGFTTASGQASDDGNTITFEGKQPFPGMGEVAFKQVIRMIDAGHHVMEWYFPTPAGEMFKMMELSYTRIE
jgi:hypothetical protein